MMSTHAASHEVTRITFNRCLTIGEDRIGRLGVRVKGYSALLESTYDR